MKKLSVKDSSILVFETDEDYQREEKVFMQRQLVRNVQMRRSRANRQPSSQASKLQNHQVEQPLLLQVGDLTEIRQQIVSALESGINSKVQICNLFFSLFAL